MESERMKPAERRDLANHVRERVMSILTQVCCIPDDETDRAHIGAAGAVAAFAVFSELLERASGEKVTPTGAARALAIAIELGHAATDATLEEMARAARGDG